MTKKKAEPEPGGLRWARMNSAYDIEAWLRNDNAAIRTWAALTQCGMGITFGGETAPKESDPYGQVVGWETPTSLVDVDDLSWRYINPMWNGQIPLTQASMQAFWDRSMTDFRDADWYYSPERVARAELFGDPETYLEAYERTPQRSLGISEETYFWDFEALLYFPLYDFEMNFVPRWRVQGFIDRINDRINRVRPRIRAAENGY